MKKRIYRAKSVKSLDFQKLIDRVENERLSVNVDVAKSVQFTSLMLRNKECLGLVKWNQLNKAENDLAMQLLGSLASSAASADLVMEPSGTYGDPLRHRARALGFTTHQVSPKRCRDYAEVYDGVPSQHDGKSAILLGRLHQEGISKPWPAASESRRDLSALVKEADIHQSAIARNLGRLEGWAARHWPELHQVMDLRRASVLYLLVHYGSPQEVARHGAEAAEVMRKIGGSLLKDAKISAVIGCARTTSGVPTSEGESRYVQALAEEILRSRKCLAEVEKRVRARGDLEPSVTAMSPVLGLMTSVVLFVELGDPRSFPNSRAYVKAAGLNLRERSSGQHVGQLRLSKRGSGRARKWLYLAVLRLIQRDPVVKAWYLSKVRRDGGKIRKKALIAVMRKLASSLVHVATGEPFDSRKLFDTDALAKASRAAS